jgi:hypothetical protein
MMIPVMTSPRIQFERIAELVMTRPPLTVILVYVATLASRFARRVRKTGEVNALVRDLDRE